MNFDLMPPYSIVESIQVEIGRNSSLESFIVGL